MATDRVRIALVDDRPHFARGLTLLLPAVTAERVQVAGTTDDATAAAGLVRRCRPDLVAALPRQLRVSGRTEAAALAGRAGLLDEPARPRRPARPPARSGPPAADPGGVRTPARSGTGSAR